MTHLTALVLVYTPVRSSPVYLIGTKIPSKHQTMQTNVCASRLLLKLERCALYRSDMFPN